MIGGDGTLSPHDIETASGMLQGRNINPKVYAGLASAVVLTFCIAAMGLLPWPAKWRGVKVNDPPPQTWWLSTFWLFTWVVPAAYVFYALTVSNYARPKDWIEMVGATFSNRWTMILIAIVCVAALKSQPSPL